MTEVVQVVDEETGTSGVVSSEQDTGQGAGPKAPGWYPTRANPSDQTYWDGQDWTARRRWTTGKGWVVVGDAPEEATTGAPLSPDRQRASANPYAPVASAKNTATGLTLSIGDTLLLVCGIALMYGSIGTWIHISTNLGIANFSASYNGIDAGISNLISVNGWVTFIGGILLVIFACFQMTSNEVQVAVFTTLVAAATAVFAIYDMFRIVQKISGVPAAVSPDISVGWGLICVLSAAVLAVLIAIVNLVQR
jgi:hypothetical protein